MGGNECLKDNSAECLDDSLINMFTDTYKPGDVIYFKYYKENTNDETPVGAVYILMKLGETGSYLNLGTQKLIKVFDGTVAKEGSTMDSPLVDSKTNEFYLNRIAKNSVDIVPTEVSSKADISTAKTINAYKLGSLKTQATTDINAFKTTVSAVGTGIEKSLGLISDAQSSGVISAQTTLEAACIDAIKKQIPNVDLDLSPTTSDPDAKAIISYLKLAEKQVAPFLRYQEIITKFGLTTSVDKIPINMLEQLSRLLNSNLGNEDSIIKSIKEFYTSNTLIIKNRSDMLAYIKDRSRNQDTPSWNKFTWGGSGIPELPADIKLIIIGVEFDKTRSNYYPVFLTSDPTNPFISSLTAKYTKPCPTKLVQDVILFEYKLGISCMKSDTRLSQGASATAVRGTSSGLSAAASSTKGFFSNMANSMANRMTTKAKPTGGRKHLSRKNRKSKK